MTPTLALDLTRLALAPVRRAPRGIDRVELAYARHYLNNWPGECVPVLPMPWGVRCYRRSQGLEFLQAVEALWRETIGPYEDPVYLKAKTFLVNEMRKPHETLKGVKPTLVEQSWGYLRLLSVTGISFGRSVVRALPQGAIYLNVGQLEVFHPFMSWLHRRRDIRSIFMIHDLIPLELPEHHLPIGIKLHERIVRNTAEFAQALITPSHAVRESVRATLSKCGRGDIPVHVEHLAVAPEFLEPMDKDPDLAGLNYFVICGAIDSYKNHIMLLRIWCELVARRGAEAPKLVIAGGPGVTSDQVLDFIGKAGEIREHVMLASGLSTRALRQLIMNARALLMPSLAEGFGLPVVEALAQGTSVLASDIAAHQEAGQGGDVTFLPATDEARWLAAIDAVATGSGAAPASQAYRPKTWSDYFKGIDEFLLSDRLRQVAATDGISA